MTKVYVPDDDDLPELPPLTAEDLRRAMDRACDTLDSLPRWLVGERGYNDERNVNDKAH